MRTKRNHCAGVDVGFNFINRLGRRQAQFPGKKVFRAWKGYRFEVLDELQKQDLIYQVPGGKSLLLYEKEKKKPGN